MKKLWSVDTPEYHTAMRISEGKHTHPRREEPGLSVQTQKRTHRRTAYTWARGGALATESADPGSGGGVVLAGSLSQSGGHHTKVHKMLAGVSYVPRAQGSLSP